MQGAKRAVQICCTSDFSIEAVRPKRVRRTVQVILACPLTSMLNKDTPKHETCVPCVGKGFNPPWPTEVGPTTLKSALRHAILVGCGRCFTLTSMFNKDAPKHATCVPCVGKGFNPPWPTEVGPTTRHSCRL